MKVVIFYDRTSEEEAGPDQLDTLTQAEAVERALDGLGHESRRLAFSMDLRLSMETLQGWGPDLVFNLVESVEGQGRFLYMAPAALDFLGVPYTGSPTDAIFATSNKLITKKLLLGAGIPTPQSLSMEEAQDRHLLLDGAFIIKSVWEHASLGIGDDAVVSVKDTGQLFLEMVCRRGQLGGACFAERYIDGREFNLSLLATGKGIEVLPPAEIRFEAYPAGKMKIVGYDAKWDKNSFEYQQTERSFEFTKRDEPLLGNLADIAKRCWHLFGLRGYGRVDFRVDDQSRPYVLEINANPCISPDAGFMAAASRAGKDYTRVVECIINDAAATPGTRGRQHRA